MDRCTYKRSKIAAERLVEAMVARDGLPTVIVNPSTPIGPRDVRPTPIGRIIDEAARGRMPGCVDPGSILFMSTTSPTASRGAATRCGGRALHSRRRECAACRHARRYRAPGRPPCAAAARAPRGRHAGRLRRRSDGRFTGREPFATVDGLRMAKHHMFFTSAKAERDLGFRARPYREALADAIDWVREGALSLIAAHHDA